MSFRPTLMFLLLSLALGVRPVGALSEAEKRELFLKAREEMRTVPAATPRPTVRPKPKPATPRPTPKSTPAPTPKPQPEPEPTPAPEATPRATEPQQPSPKPSPTPSPARPSATPKPAPKPIPKAGADARPKPTAPITIEKSGLAEEEGFQPPPEREKRGFLGFGRPAARYRYLTPAVRDAIDRAPVKKRRWKFIVVHNSGSRQGNAKIFEHYHRRVRKMPNGMAYHFVIGNGTSSGNGLIEIGGRWTRQINGGHVHSDYLNNIALGICLVGDYNRHSPTPEQLESLTELIRYLQRRCGKVEGQWPVVKPHKGINPPRWPTDCPGDRFPYKWLTRFN